MEGDIFHVAPQTGYNAMIMNGYIFHRCLRVVLLFFLYQSGSIKMR